MTRIRILALLFAVILSLTACTGTTYTRGEESVQDAEASVSSATVTTEKENTETTGTTTTGVTAVGTTTTNSTTNTTNPITTTTSQTTTTTHKITTTTIQTAVYTESAVLMVWIPQSGSKYHSKSSCSGMKGPSQVTLDRAISLGYTPCKRCYG